MDEAGLKGFEAVSWHMIGGPSGHAERYRLPPETANSIQHAFRASADFKVAECRSHEGADRDRPRPPPAELHVKFLAEEIASWVPAREGRRHRGAQE